MHEVTLGAGALADQSLGEARVRERFGVTVVSVERPGGEAVVNPSADTHLRPGDRLRVFGLPEQVAAFRQRGHARRLTGRLSYLRKPFQRARAKATTVRPTVASAATRSSPRSERRSPWPTASAAR